MTKSAHYLGAFIFILRHMKINNKSKVAMNIFHQARRRIALIAGLLEQFADAA